MRLLENKVAFITGAAAGIGEGTAHLLAQHGARVFALDLDKGGAARVAAAIVAGGGSAFAFGCDVRRPDTIRPAVESALERFDRIDILINNAGIYPRRLFLEMTEAEWDEMFDTNLKGMFHVTKLVAPHMVQRRFGKIVNISSVTFFKGLPRMSHYVATKGGVIGLTRSLAREMGPHNVYVNCITPGAIEVEHEKRFLKLLENVETGKVFKKDAKTKWICRNCGYHHEGTGAPEQCPTCLHPKSFFELWAENY